MPPLSSPLGKVLFSMTGELVKFGVVMLVVMAGFVVSFFSIFHRNVTFGKVRLKLWLPSVCGDVVRPCRIPTGSHQNSYAEDLFAGGGKPKICLPR